MTLAIGTLLNALLDIYARTTHARTRSIKGYVQLAKMILYIFAAIIIVATLIDRSPLLLLSGLGAMSAVILLVYKDTLLSFVASVQLTSNDMLRVGDWIEMPQVGADGDVVDITLHTVKVQNFDKTIVSIPTAPDVRVVQKLAWHAAIRRTTHQAQPVHRRQRRAFRA